MTIKISLTVEKLARLIAGTVKGDQHLVVDRLVEVKQFSQEKAKGSVVLAVDKNSCELIKKYSPYVVVTHSFQPELKATQIIIDENKEILIKLLNIFYPDKQNHFISKQADISKSAQINDSCQIYSGVVIGDNVQLGKNVIIYPNVVIYADCVIGDNVIIHSGSIIGADGFGYLQINKQHIKVPQKGNVVIGNNVEIGANTTIDRATIGSTTIGDGTKIDNLCHVAHNCQIGQNCILAGATFISGSCIIEDDVTLAGNVGVIDHVHIGKGAILLARSTVFKNVPAGAVFSGSPAKENIHDKKISIILNKLPNVWSKFKKMLNKFECE